MTAVRCTHSCPTVGAAGAVAQGLTFYHTITGEDLKIPESTNPEGRDTEGVKKFLEAGINPYNEVKACLDEGEQTYLASCSGCHGHVGEGKHARVTGISSSTAVVTVCVPL